MVDGTHERQRSAYDSSKLSVWTVVGAVAASVITAGLLGGASGILQIPNALTNITNLQSSFIDQQKATGVISERISRSELVYQDAQRQLNAIQLRVDSLVARIERKEEADRNLDIQTQRDVASLEGRSKDRNTESLGEIRSVKSLVDGLSDRQKQTAEAVNGVRQNVYDLATRIYRQTNQQSLPVPLEPRSRSYGTPMDGSRQLEATARTSFTTIRPDNNRK